MNAVLYAVHKPIYWEMDVSHVAREIFTNMVSIDLPGSRSKELFRNYP